MLTTGFPEPFSSLFAPTRKVFVIESKGQLTSSVKDEINFPVAVRLSMPGPADHKMMGLEGRGVCVTVSEKGSIFPK